MAGEIELLRLEDSHILSMSTNPAFLTEFPFLSRAKELNKAKRGCGTCGRSAKTRNTVMSDIRRSIINLGEDKKRQLKKMLKTKKLRLRLSLAGKVTEYTF